MLLVYTVDKSFQFSIETIINFLQRKEGRKEVQIDRIKCSVLVFFYTWKASNAVANV